ncbi:hypothetical protein EsDP_00007013 [Epichloe bromicola]|uniref:Ankyrin repeat protein n=1 Tax=Epichloe bromicola TaxID=79588 RepID=A0ABQ0CZA7_9HYPO
MDLAQSLLCCFPSGASRRSPERPLHVTERKTTSNENEPLLAAAEKSTHHMEQVSIDVVVRLYSADDGHHLRAELGRVVGAAGWSEALATKVLAALVRALEEGREKMGAAMRDAYDEATRIADLEFRQLARWARENPKEAACAVLLTIVAFGVLVALAPYVLELLGFGELGPAAGEF